MSDIPPELARLRASIDNLDAALVHLLAERFRCTQQVGVLKAELRMPPSDPEREVAQMTRLRALAEESGLDPVFAEKFLAFIIAEVIRNHGVIASDPVPASDHTPASDHVPASDHTPASDHVPASDHTPSPRGQ